MLNKIIIEDRTYTVWTVHQRYLFHGIIEYGVKSSSILIAYYKTIKLSINILMAAGPVSYTVHQR